MRLKLLFILLLVLPLGVQAYTITSNTIAGSVVEGESLEFEFTILNEKPFNDVVWFFDLIDDRLFNVRYSESRVNLEAGENRTVMMHVDSKPDTPLLIEIPFKIYFSNPAQENEEVVFKGKFLKASDFRPVITGYSFMDVFDPRAPQGLYVNVYNPTNSFMEAEVRYEMLRDDAVIFNDSVQKRIEPYTTEKVFFEVEMDYDQDPGFYTIRFRAYNRGFANEWNETEFQVIGYGEFQVSSPIINQDLLGKILRINVTNVGTEISGFSLPLRIAPVEMFFNYETSGDVSFEDGQVIFSGTVEPGETAELVYKVTYLPLIILPVLIVLAYYVYAYLTRKVGISRKIVPMLIGENSSSFKVTIRLRNLTNEKIKGVRVKEALLPFIKKIGSYGTLHPKQIRDLTGKKLLWDVGDMAPKSEVVITYQFQTSFGILGKIIIPGSKAEFKYKGKSGVSRSGTSIIPTSINH